MQTLTITQPDDWHLHVRDGQALKSVIAHTAAQFARAIIMPNLTPPVCTVEAAEAYRSRILNALPKGVAFEPLMTLYLTNATQAEEIRRASESGFVKAVKLYPAGATTNSEHGVQRISSLYPVLEAMQSCGLPLLVHAEVVDANVDVFDRERVFIDRHLNEIRSHFPALKIVLEHATTKDAIAFVEAHDHTAATLTPQHLLYNRNHLLVGGIRPHNYCLPVLKREQHREALVQAATSGNPKYFLGTDSAPHATSRKENACGCAGCYTANSALALYAELFEQQNALDKLEGFASWYGPDFYGLPRNRGNVTLVKSDWQIPDSYPYTETETLTPFRAGETLHWQVQT